MPQNNKIWRVNVWFENIVSCQIEHKYTMSNRDNSFNDSITQRWGHLNNSNCFNIYNREGRADSIYTNPIVVIKLVVKEPSENRKRRQLFPTPVGIYVERLKNRTKATETKYSNYYNKIFYKVGSYHANQYKAKSIFLTWSFVGCEETSPAHHNGA